MTKTLFWLLLIHLFRSGLQSVRIDLCLTHWDRVTHICVGKTTIISSDNGLAPCRRQAIIWTNAGILLIGTLGTNFSGILIEWYSFSFKKMHMKMSSGKWRPSCLGLNMLKTWRPHDMETLLALQSLCGGNPPVIVTLDPLYKRPVRRGLDAFFVYSLMHLLNKQPNCRWSVMQYCSLWRVFITFTAGTRTLISGKTVAPPSRTSLSCGGKRNGISN